MGDIWDCSRVFGIALGFLNTVFIPPGKELCWVVFPSEMLRGRLRLPGSRRGGSLLPAGLSPLGKL